MSDIRGHRQDRRGGILHRASNTDVRLRCAEVDVVECQSRRRICRVIGNAAVPLEVRHPWPCKPESECGEIETTACGPDSDVPSEGERSHLRRRAVGLGNIEVTVNDL